MNLDLSSLKTIKKILTKYKTVPYKGMGQNFLVNKAVLEKIIESANLKPKDIVLEVGPGIGTLTQKLAERAKKVIVVEKDRKMIEILKETLKETLNYGRSKKFTIVNFLLRPNNIEIINGDVLKIENCKLVENYKLKIENYKVVANLPYYIASPVIRKFLETQYPPEFMVLMVQKEVAQRICAKPPNMSILAVSVQFYAKSEIISYVKKENFWPKPKVDSAIIKITPRGLTSLKARGQTSPDLFFKIVKAGFLQPRKQLVNNLSFLKLANNVKLTKSQINSWLLRNNIKPTQRAETLNVDDWINLTNNF